MYQVKRNVRIELLATAFVMVTWSIASFANGSVYDPIRDRHIPVFISEPANPVSCHNDTPCQVAFLSAGYGVSHRDYQFVVTTLNDINYLVVAVGHELPQDPPLSRTGDLYQTRRENWQRGAVTLHFLRDYLRDKMDRYDFDSALLVGHSNGGDISSWLIDQGADWVSGVITLDHRRVPLPRNPDMKVLSIRASDFAADEGVLPEGQALHASGVCILSIPDAKHNDMSDSGPGWLRDLISEHIRVFIGSDTCPKGEQKDVGIQNH